MSLHVTPEEIPLSPILKRRGRFKISCELLRRSGHGLSGALFSHMVVTRAECHFSGDVIEYHAVSALFREVEEGCEAPEYQFTFQRIGDTVILTNVQ